MSPDVTYMHFIVCIINVCDLHIQRILYASQFLFYDLLNHLINYSTNPQKEECLILDEKTHPSEQDMVIKLNYFA